METSNETMGGLRYEAWFAQARAVADTLLEAAPDRYGKVHTPLWVGIIDPETHRLIEEKPPNWMTYWDAEDYVMTAHGSNLYRDQNMLRAFLSLSDITGDQQYREVVQTYLDFYLRECPSETTGLLPWGEHMSYNCVRDRLTAERHEMEHSLPDWELLWSVNPEATQRAIEAIYHYHIYDKEAFYYDRHGNYYTGEFDPMPVRGTYIKHSGLYAYSFLFLYNKTGDPKHQAWAQGMADLYWSRRDPKTNLVPGYVSSGGVQETTGTQLLLASHLLEAGMQHQDHFFLDRGLGMVDAYLKYGYDRENNEFTGGLNIRTGEEARPPAETPWQPGEYADFYRLKAVWKAYGYTGDTKYLEVVLARLQQVARKSISEKIEPHTAGNWLELYINAFEATGDITYLRYARTFMAWTQEHLLRNDMIIESADGYVYHSMSRPGTLLSAWLRLYALEREFPLHWQAPDAVRSDSKTLPLELRGENIQVTWRFQDGREGRSQVDAQESTIVLLTLPEDVAQGPVTLRFKSGKTAVEETEVLIAKNPDGPAFSAWDYPEWVASDEQLDGKVKVEDSSGIIQVRCRYFQGEGEEAVVNCRLLEDDYYAFSIPALGAAAGEAFSFTLEATSNPAWPINRYAKPQQVIIAQRDEVTIPREEHAGRTRIFEGGSFPVQLSVMGAEATEDSYILCAQATQMPPGMFDGLPENRLSPFLRIENYGTLPLEVGLSYDPEQTLHTFAPSITIYHWEGTVWQRVPKSRNDAGSHTIAFPCPEDGVYVVAGDSRLVWKRSFNGALLSSPSLARTDNNGGLAIILDTRKPDGMLYALDTQGETLWTYDMDDEQSFAAIADFDGDAIDEIAVGGPTLTLLNSDGSFRWEAALHDALTPVIGDLEGDGDLEVVAASSAGPIAAFTGKGEKLWETTVEAGWRPHPGLGNLDDTPGLEVLFGKAGYYYAFDGETGDTLWKTSVEGEVLNAPAVADIDEDGRDEVVFFSRTDEKGTLYALDDDGTILWSVPTNRNSDWSPVICDFDGTGALRIIAQEPSAEQIGIYSAQGERLRVISTPGRIMHTPVITDFNGDGKLDLLNAFDIAMQVRAYGNDGKILWAYTPESLTMDGAKIKGNGTMLVADLDGDGYLEVVGGDDLTWLQLFKTDTRCEPWTVVSGQFQGDAQHSGYYRSSAN